MKLIRLISTLSICSTAALGNSGGRQLPQWKPLPETAYRNLPIPIQDVPIEDDEPDAEIQFMRTGPKSPKSGAALPNFQMNNPGWRQPQELSHPVKRTGYEGSLEIPHTPPNSQMNNPGWRRPQDLPSPPEEAPKRRNKFFSRQKRPVELESPMRRSRESAVASQIENKLRRGIKQSDRKAQSLLNVDTISDESLIEVIAVEEEALGDWIELINLEIKEDQMSKAEKDKKEWHGLIFRNSVHKRLLYMRKYKRAKAVLEESEMSTTGFTKTQEFPYVIQAREDVLEGLKSVIKEFRRIIQVKLVLKMDTGRVKEELSWLENSYRTATGRFNLGKLLNYVPLERLEEETPQIIYHIQNIEHALAEEILY